MSGRILGAVLAGGASSRFGSDKALAVIAGRTLLERAAAMLAGHVDEVVVVGRDAIADLPRAGLGPLGGIAAALDAAGRGSFGGVLTVACDMVRLPGGLIEALMDRAPAYCSDAPVLGHWPTSLAGALLERLTTLAPPSRPCAGIHGSANAEADALAARWTPGRARGDGAGGENPRHRRDPTLSVRRWAIDIGAVAIPSPVPIPNINTPGDLAAL